MANLKSARSGTPGSATHIHLYAQCWNDEFMLPFFFRHYDPIVDRYIIYDDGSTDASLQILANHPRTEVRSFPRSNPESFVLSEQSFSNQCWKESRGEADWVIVTDIDEHLFHIGFRRYLSDASREGVTLVPALGFQMIADELPAGHEQLSRSYQFGAPWGRMLKASIFDSAAITEINFGLGRHWAEPSGEVWAPPTDEVLLLHYKYLNVRRTYARHQELLHRLGPGDLAGGFGHKYGWSLPQLESDWDNVRRNAVDYREFVGAQPSAYPIERWWERFRTQHRRTGPVPVTAPRPRIV